MEKFGTNMDNTDKIGKILLQLEQTENTLLNNLDRSLKLKIDRKKIDARSESIMSSVYPDDNSMVIINKKSYYYLVYMLIIYSIIQNENLYNLNRCIFKQ